MKIMVMLTAILAVVGWVLCGAVKAADALDMPESASLATCQRFAEQYYKRENPDNFLSLKLLDEDLQEDKYEDKLGSQFISTVLSGHGVWTGKDSGPANVRFTCLLENDKKAVFIHLVNDVDRNPVDVCWDRFEPGEWGKMSQCLQSALKREENKLADLLKKAEQQTSQSLTQAAAKQTLDTSNQQWTIYRDAECARRQAQVAGRNHPDVGEFTCRINKTRERISDLQFDD
jgi:uncharacterized protein YecT (DUF1311 family)